jgi:hypothetical protein
MSLAVHILPDIQVLYEICWIVIRESIVISFLPCSVAFGNLSVYEFLMILPFLQLILYAGVYTVVLLPTTYIHRACCTNNLARCYFLSASALPVRLALLCASV